MAKYLVLIYETEDEIGRADNPEYQKHWTFIAQNTGSIVAGEGLLPTGTATSLRRDASAGGFAVTDGPFVETKEALGGFYLLEAADLDEAIELAKQVPAPYGGVEIRPVMVFEQKEF